jgi:hypothetical protein
VLFVSPHGHSYDSDPVTREEGGTPAIVESIRAGLVFALREQVGVDEIRRREHQLARRALASWSANPNIEILGNTAADRLPIISFAVRHPPRLLHSNFVVSLLSDLFGIQARSGCFCAGPYLHRVYAIDDEWSACIEDQCSLGQLGAKLSFARLGFNYFIGDTVFEYIVAAVHFLAEHAWKLLPLYRFDPASGLWQHRDARPAPTLADAPLPRTTREADQALAERLEEARQIVRAVETAPPRPPAPDPALSPEFEHIRWFPLPAEALARLAAAAAA